MEDEDDLMTEEGRRDTRTRVCEVKANTLMLSHACPLTATPWPRNSLQRRAAVRRASRSSHDKELLMKGISRGWRELVLVIWELFHHGSCFSTNAS